MSSLASVSSLSSLELVHTLIDEVIALSMAALTPDRQGLIHQWRSPEEIRTEWKLELPNQGVSSEQLLAEIQTYFDQSVNTNHPQFLNQLWGGVEPIALLTALITTATHTSMHTYDVAPVATLMEQLLMEKLNSLIGFEGGEGIMVTGGSNANLLAMLCARHHLSPTTKQQGINHQRLVAFVSDQAHYSLKKAANVIGIGTDNLIRIPSDDLGRMLPAALEAAIQEQLNHGHQPFFVVATAGTTVLGAFDPIEHIGQITQKYGLWLHIDGAWGGPVAFSDRHRHLLEGSYLGDSFTWDAHKLMGLPLSCSALLVKHRGTLLATTGDQDNEEQYLFHHEPEYGYDLGMMSLQCGRPADVLKLWFAWQHHGLEGYRDRVDHLYDLAHYCSEFVRHHPDLELITEPTYLNICFRYNPHHSSLPEPELERLNLAIRNELKRSGLTMVNYAKVKGRVIIRLVLPNGALQQEDLEQFFNNFLTVAAMQNLNHHHPTKT